VLGELVEMIPGSPIYKLKTRMAIRLSSFVFLHQNAGRKHQKKENDGLLRVIMETHSSVRKTATYGSLHFVGENGPTPENPDPISAIASREKVSKIYSHIL
jgi:uncharacterized protein Veg